MSAIAQPDNNPPTIKLIYNAFNRSAKKIATLVKMANLNFVTETITLDKDEKKNQNPHILQTPYG